MTKKKKRSKKSVKRSFKKDVMKLSVEEIKDKSMEVDQESNKRKIDETQRESGRY